MVNKGQINKVLIIGSGPIEIGQAAEFDYAGTQACSALREEGIKVILVNSNPATIMTDTQIADLVYIEPLTVEVVEKIIEREHPDGILATTGGQTGLNLAMELDKAGILAKHGIPILGTDVAAIKLAEDRSLFRELMFDIGQPIPKSLIIEDYDTAIDFVKQVGLPIVVRPAYTLGGTGGGIAITETDLRKYVQSGLRQSPINQVLLEQSIAGLIEVEYEVLRDSSDKTLIVCDMENIDPVGVHTGDSIVVAPCQTISKAKQVVLEQASHEIVKALDVQGSCNVQFAVDPDSDKYYVIEVNPRVSRSSALASKATGYPIARVASKIALGFLLADLNADERPVVDYVVTKIPRWPFDKFAGANRHLSTQMKATGEVMSIGGNFYESLQKAVRSLELDCDSLFDTALDHLSDKELEQRLVDPDDQRLFLVVEYLKRRYTEDAIDSLYRLTKIRHFFLAKLKTIVDYHQCLNQQQELDFDSLQKAKQLGFSDASIGRCFGVSTGEIRQIRQRMQIIPKYDRIKSVTQPYYYSTYNPCADMDSTDGAKTNKPRVIVLGAGPIRIGQGIEFDYSTVHAAWAIHKQGYEAVVINNNPETVSTDSNISDRLYFEPLTSEDVLNVIEQEQPFGVVVQFGGQTAINLVECLRREGIRILGTSADGIAGMEDRHQFDLAMAELSILRPAGMIAHSKQEAGELVTKISYPVVVRPSYVLGGRGMEVINSQEELQDYLTHAHEYKGYPLLIDCYLPGVEIEVDAVSDGENVFLPGIMEHLERAGVHSGDSIAVFPALSLDHEMIDKVYRYTSKIATYFNVKGFLNIQFVVSNGKLYVLEVNPRSSRTVPFLSKVTGIQLAQLATNASLGIKLTDSGYVGLHPNKQSIVSVKVPVFSFAKLQGMEITLGPEMKSTGEVMGRGKNLEKALYKGFIAANVQMPLKDKVLVTVADKDKKEIIELAREMKRLGFNIYATIGTAEVLQAKGIKCRTVAKLTQSNEIIDLIEQEQVDIVVNTYTKGKQPHRDGFRIRTAAVENGIHCFTSLDTLRAYLQVVADQELWLEPLLSQ